MCARTSAGDLPDRDPEDAALIARSLAGEADAFDVLVRRYHRQALAVGYRMLGNGQDAADVAQDAFLRAYRNLGTLKDRDRFGPWLMRIVSNLSLNARRSRKSGTGGSTVSLDEVGDKVHALRTPDGQSVLQGMVPADSPQSAEVLEAIREAIDALPEKQRLALVLFSIEGMPQRDVATVMGCSVELVKWNVFQARKRLRDALREYL